MAHQSCECCSTQDPDRFKRNVREHRSREEERLAFFRQCNAALRLIENAPFCDARTLALERLKELENYWAVKIPPDSLSSAKSESSAQAVRRDRSVPRVDSHNDAFEEHLRARRRQFEPIHPSSDSVDGDRSPRRSRVDKYRDVACRVYDARTPRKSNEDREESPRRRSLSACSHGDRVPRVALLADRAAEAGALRRRQLEAKRTELQALARQRSQSKPRTRSQSSHAQYATVPSTLHRYFTGKEPMVPPKDNPRSIIESRREEEERLIKHWPRSTTPGRAFPAYPSPLATEQTASRTPQRRVTGGSRSAEGSPVRGRVSSFPEKRVQARGEEVRPRALSLRRASMPDDSSVLTASTVNAPSISLDPSTPQAGSLPKAPADALTLPGAAAQPQERPPSPAVAASGSAIVPVPRSPTSPAPSSISRDSAPRFQSPTTSSRTQSPAARAAGGGMVTLDFHLGRVPRRRSRDDGDDGRRLSWDEDLRDPIGLRTALAAAEAAQKGPAGPRCEEDLSNGQPEFISRITGLDAAEFTRLAARVSEAVQGSKWSGDPPQATSPEKGSLNRPTASQQVPRENLDDMWAIQSFNEDFA